ncbi:hypothetical protein FLJC2902T_22350 [Flavobacterium limnosediminis JC2902]|uniref:Lipoprotein n=1 Tax=Flavobacterium limnosediminis JC2902 TaxID=1341181 RepID=V6SKJ6_9FLAO|nr:hypothetical protein [Flavobacterium limnosediminis]ESU27126.1 hypothetical protein FLJC2902T_22350 [Flavobacterium limnosediminis JC2902]
MKNFVIILGLLFGLLSSCNKHGNNIIEIDPDKIRSNASKNGLTVEENEKLNMTIDDSIKKNTTGKTLPNIIITDISYQKKFFLDELDNIDGDFILISTDVYCGFGLECLIDIFPKSYKKFSKENKSVPVICLIKRTEDDINNLKRINKTIDEIKPFYDSIYIIDEKEANKLNMLVNPSRLYVTEEMVVKNIKFGINLSGDLYDEIRQNINIKR